MHLGASLGLATRKDGSDCFPARFIAKAGRITWQPQRRAIFLLVLPAAAAAAAAPSLAAASAGGWWLVIVCSLCQAGLGPFMLFPSLLFNVAPVYSS